MQDKSERLIQERIKKLWENTDFTSTLFESLTGYAVIAADFDGVIIAYNKGARQIYGYAAEEIIGRENIEIFFPEDLVEGKRLQHIIKDLIGQGRFSYEGEKVRKNGETFPAEILFTLTNDRQGKVVGFVEIVRDLTEPKRVEEELKTHRDRLEELVKNRTAQLTRANEELQYETAERKQVEETRKRLATAVEQSTDMIVITDTEGTIQYVNPAFERITGYSKEEAVGQNPRILKSGQHDRSFYQEMWNTITQGQAWKGSYFNKKKDGPLYQVQSAITPVRDASGKIINYVDVQRDVTQEAALAEQLRHSQKMEAVGRLAGGVAHDFNNLLTAIIGYSDILLQSLGNGHPLRADTEEIKKAGERAASLTSQLLAFSRKQILQPRVLDLNEVVANMDKMLRRLIGEDIELVTLFGSELGHVKVDPGQIEQIIMNLAVNARDAMPQGGKLTIETNNAELDEAYARKHLAVVPGQYVMLAVSDTGCGMDAETQSRIFEPYFTTKEAEKGTGLGLSTVYGIVKQSGGNIWVYSEPGQGTTFKVYVPRDDKPTEQMEKRTIVAEMLHGSETILVVEDEEMVRKLACRALRMNGYQVVEVPNSSNAPLISERYEGPIHLLLTDVVMPQMSGRELASRLTSMRPTMKVLYMSGYTDNAIVHHGVLDAGLAFIQKPFTPSRLARKVREVLDAVPGCR